MQIPLDYYRILGLPIQATADQLKQAHRDRGLQLPRREFSTAAIEARKQLIDDAYSVLSNPDRRRDYDSKFLASAYTVDMAPEPLLEARNSGLEVSADLGEAALRSLATEPGGSEAQSSKIEIESDQLVGALLLLLELGEYEQVLQLGQPQLSNPYASADGGMPPPDSAQADVVLTLALACLELGREQWQQRQYEVAAESLQTGHELLARGNHFPNLRAEIQTELYKLRPYRVLELLARPLDQTRERRQGIKLLKAMLEDRGGIEGTEDDLSGLAIDDFLRFIQQLRDYLTASEQQELFEHEARRPSPVATYLTVYALLARGFARHQPALVRRAKQLLLRLGAQQDVHLEQAVCALLLGQTEEANRALEMSQEYEPLAYIREHSRQSPDLLPGLCLYAERWLKDELFPHFRDFKNQEATLKDYFADAQVQAYLETMPTGPTEARSPQFPATATAPPGTDQYANVHYSDDQYSETRYADGQYLGPQYSGTQYSSAQVPTIEGSLPIGAPTMPSPPASRRDEGPNQRSKASYGNGSNGYNGNGYTSSADAAPSHNGNGNGRLGPAALQDEQADPTPPDFRRAALHDENLSVAERVAQLSPEGKMAGAGIARDADSKREAPKRGALKREVSKREVSKRGAPKPSDRAAAPRERRASASDPGTLAPGQAFSSENAELRRDRPAAPRWGRLALVGLAGIVGVGILGFGTMRALGWVAGVFSGPRISGQPLAIRLDQPAFEIPDAPPAPTEIGVNDMAGRVINEWLEIKRGALGESYQGDRLDDILLEPVLTQWRRRADAAAAESWYWEYEHTVEIESVSPDDPTADQLQAIALVSEQARLFEFGVENTSAAYNDTLRMQYDLVRQDGKWFVQGMSKLADAN
ncbi:IMS domain-containing protein [Nodosilinea sp. E11]|uniref:IMS domain-containing protein n=1 Tax=Nodosilinea sp. E11 TaxID=3037479 RepID=UPI002934ED6D|nr:IMS domain-containing protein [Nodosilinea sp. E11]WOD40780.1 IMS domain-containing protein [Nodosilinea sp. E11]